MRLLRLSEVEMSPRDRVFYYSRTWAVALALIALGTVAWLVFYSFNAGWKLGYYIAGVIVLFSELLRRFITARFRPTNWLARTNDEGVFIQFRSYLNYHLPAEDLTVVFGFQVEGDRALVRPLRQEAGAHLAAVEFLVAARGAALVRIVRIVHLDDIGAEHGELISGERPRQHVRHVDHADSLERPHRVLPFALSR